MNRTKKSEIDLLRDALRQEALLRIKDCEDRNAYKRRANIAEAQVEALKAELKAQEETNDRVVNRLSKALREWLDLGDVSSGGYGGTLIERSEEALSRVSRSEPAPPNDDEPLEWMNHPERGMVTVWDDSGQYLGCMGVETWRDALHDWNRIDDAEMRLAVAVAALEDIVAQKPVVRNGMNFLRPGPDRAAAALTLLAAPSPPTELRDDLNRAQLEVLAWKRDCETLETRLRDVTANYDELRALASDAVKHMGPTRHITLVQLAEVLARQPDEPIEYCPTYQDEYQRLWHESQAEVRRLRDELARLAPPVPEEQQ